MAWTNPSASKTYPFSEQSFGSAPRGGSTRAGSPAQPLPVTWLNLHRSGGSAAPEYSKAFDELGLKKLPTVKSLSAEYAELLARKKAAYAEYAEAKKEMRDLLVHKANVEYILGSEEQEKTKIRAQEREEK